jgi:S1-C subfamily serine protease
MGTVTEIAKRDEQALDAYSSAVVRVVERIGPAVASLGVRRWRREGTGSGFAIAPDGILLTNSHVVHQAAQIRVRLRDGSELDATVVGDDPPTDLAVVRVRANDLPFVAVDARTAPIPGQLAIAIGNPLGFDATVSAGVVSATGRMLFGREHTIDDLIQHTAPLNPGSSGGPLLNSAGELLGINTAMIHQSQGIGFSVPAATAHWVAGQLLAHGRVRRAVIGIAGVTRPLGRLRELRSEGAATGVEVREVMANGPAQSAGVQVGDVLLRFDGRPIETVTALSRLLWRWEGAEAALDIARDGRRLTMSVRPARS